MEEILNYYYANDARNLVRMVDRLLSKFGGISQADYDDFYSLAGEVLAQIVEHYDTTRDFNTYFYSCLDRKIKTEFTRRNREKRMADRQAVSIETPIGEDGLTVGDTLVSEFDIDKEVFRVDIESTNLAAYLNRLSKVQRKIFHMMAYGVPPAVIENELQISHKQYLDGIEAIYSYENVVVFE